MADILREDPEKLDEAYGYAEISYQRGQEASLTIMAMIKLDKEEYNDALDLIQSFRPTTLLENTIAKTIEAKANTGLLDFSRASEILSQLDHTEDHYVCLAMINNAIEETKHLFFEGNKATSVKKYRELEIMIREGRQNFPMHTQFNAVEELRAELRTLLELNEPK